MVDAVGGGWRLGLVGDDGGRLVGVVDSWMVVVGPKHADKNREANNEIKLVLLFCLLGLSGGKRDIK